MGEAEWYSAYPKVAPEVRLGPPFMTKYERARIIGVRALQLSFGAPPLVPPEAVGSRDTLTIARYEVDRGLLPVTIVRYRRAPGGLGEPAFEPIPLRVLLEVERRVIGRRIFR